MCPAAASDSIAELLGRVAVVRFLDVSPWSAVLPEEFSDVASTGSVAGSLGVRSVARLVTTARLPQSSFSCSLGRFPKLGKRNAMAILA